MGLFGGLGVTKIKTWVEFRYDAHIARLVTMFHASSHGVLVYSLRGGDMDSAVIPRMCFDGVDVGKKLVGSLPTIRFLRWGD